MRQSVLGADRAVCEKNIRRNILVCIFVFFAVVLIHVACIYFRTEHTHTAMLIANIAADIIGGGFLIARLSIYVLPQHKLLKFYDRATQETTGQVLEIGDSLIHHVGVNCYEVRLAERRLFLPADTIVLTVGEHYRFRLKGNLIMEVNSDA